MGDVENDVMENEFGVLATWTADAVRVLGPEYAVPAACKGSASPAMLEWLGRTTGLGQGQVLMDVGGGWVGRPSSRGESSEPGRLCWSRWLPPAGPRPNCST